MSRPLFHYSGLSHKAAFSIWRDHMKDTTQLYIYPASYVREHGELEQYRASYKANIACKEAIEQAIADHYRDNRLGTEYIRFWNNSVMTGCFMCLRARSGKRIGMGVFPAITKPGRKPFRSTRTRTASAKIGMFTLWWIVATPDLSISFLRRPGSIIQRNMGRKSRSAKA